MINKNKVTTKYITEKYLDKRFEEQTKAILEAVDFSLQKYLKNIDTRFDDVDAKFENIDTRFDDVDAKFENIDTRFDDVDAKFENIDTRFDIVNTRFNNIDTRLDKLEAELKSDINNVQTLIDGYVKAQEDFKQEFVIMKEEIRQIKAVFKQKLGVDIRAF